MRSWMYLLVVGGCGFSVGNGTIDGSSTRDGGPDAPFIGDDGLVDAPAFCYGTGFGRTCLTSEPTVPRTIGMAMFDTDGAGCTQVTNGVCIVSATDLDIPAGSSVRALGSRPLVFVASGTLQIIGTISASSLATQPPGAGSSTSPCASPTAASSDTGGGAGGAGGSFGGVGGSGGAGDLNDTGPPAGSPAGQGAAIATMPTAIRAGCTGGAGGTGVGNGGAGGPGGGAIYFIAGTSIAVPGRVFAVGQGGRGGNNLGAGGGGGSGGLLGFDAPTVTFSGTVIANGGGGGEGAGLGGASSGAAGGDGLANGARASGGVSGNTGGNGGDASGGGALDGITGESVDGGGGGGGGGAGVIYIKGTFTAGASTISPAASVTP